MLGNKYLIEIFIAFWHSPWILAHMGLRVPTLVLSSFSFNPSSLCFFFISTLLCVFIKKKITSFCFHILNLAFWEGQFFIIMLSSTFPPIFLCVSAYHFLLTSRSPPARPHQPLLLYPFIKPITFCLFPFLSLPYFARHAFHIYAPPPPFFFQHLHPLFSPPIYYP